MLDKQTDTLILPRVGRLQVDIHLSVEVNITAMVAKRKVNAFLATHVGNLLLADEPALTLGERIVWRVPVDLTSPSKGRLGRVGEVDVDIENGELFLSEAHLDAIRTQAQRLTTSTSS